MFSVPLVTVSNGTPRRERTSLTMLEVNVTQNGSEATCTLTGSLNATTAPQFRERMGELPEDTSTLVLDLKGLRYISSAGLRVILALMQQLTAKGGRMLVRNCSDFILEVFEDTGFSDLLDIEAASE